MFAPIVLPFQITLVILVVVLVSIGVFLRRKSAKAIALIFSFILFIPSCAGVAFVVDAFRYGQFNYTSATDFRDPYVEIPKNAKSITLHKYSSGHEMRFTCEPEELASWMEAVDKHRKNFIDYEPFELDEGLASNEDRNRFFESHFGRHGWKMPDDVVCYKGWRSGRGSGFDVWYSPTTKTGFVNAGYW